MFIEVIKSRENESDRNIQLLIESHSEHFLRRLQRRIAEGEIVPEDVAIYFTKIGESGSTIEPLNVDIYGNITNWPDNFFGDPIEDLAEMTKVSMKRKMGLQ
jgi:predicted ATPase